MNDLREIPLFPLRAVLFDGGRLPLRIFEPRYMDMIGDCMRESAPFGVVLIRQGRDARLSADDEQPEIFDVGTEATIVDFNQLEAGMLGILARGGRKFRVHETWELKNHLLMGRVERLPEEPSGMTTVAHGPLLDLLRQLLKHPMIEKLNLEIDFADARDLGWRLAELLPIEPEVKQSLLELDQPDERLAALDRLVSRLSA